jgi:hypothetical protein
VPKARVLIGIAAAVGLLVGWSLNAWLRPEPPVSPAASPAAGAESIAAEIAALKSALDEERSQRGALELDLAMLRRELTRRTAQQALPEPAPGAPPSRQVAAAEGEREGAPEAAKPVHTEGKRKAWFDSSLLVAQGIDEAHAAWLQEQSETLQMDELYLRDQATREGWNHSSRYRKQVQEMWGETRESLGDDDYDLLLYASNRHNRVLLSNVLQSSPAAAAGIESGDVLLRYDDRAIFQPGDLISATAEGAPESTVAVDIERDGEVMRVYLPRGPLGVQIQPARRFPADGP